MSANSNERAAVVSGGSAPVGGVVAIPQTFWLDHADRHPYDEGQEPPAAIGTRGACVLIALDDPGLPLLLADAEYYADAESMDDCPRFLRESARRTVRALRATGAAS